MEIQNKNRNMSIGGSIIAALCIIIYLAALVQGSVRIYLSIESSRNTAEREFTQIRILAESAGAQGFADERFIQTMNNALVSSRTLEAIIITGPQGALAFEKQSGRAVNWVNNTPRFINRFGFSSQDHHRPLIIPNISHASISAVASAFDFNEFSNILKQTLLIILAGFALAFFTMLMQLLLGKPERREAVYTAPNEPARKTVVKHTPVSDPKGLYNSRSNIGWEEYTKDRLDSELHRCASTENDLSLVIIEFSKIDSDAVFRQAADEAVSFFTSRDLIFEYGDNGIAVILPGISLDTAISKSEKFYQRVMEKIFYGDDSVSLLNIGLSSRTARLLNADRLILEAAEALKKAQNDPHVSIIAFKSDPEKYRAFIASQN